jgi:light-regulated signal transduction histidine kinase (bacteriophytochrome)
VESQQKTREGQQKLKKVNKELEKVNKELENFSLVAAHDLQDPLKQNQVFIKFVQDGKMDYIPKLRDNNHRMQIFIKNLLTFARSGGINLKIETVSIKTVLDDIVSDLGVMIAESKAKIVIGDMPTLRCDSVQVGRVFQNLIKNSIKYRSEQPLVIEITAVRSNKDFWSFCVKDNGIGIPAIMMPTLFTIYRGKKNDTTGAGFGLAICKRIVESHGGFIRAESSEGKGTSFMFTIRDIGCN